MIKGLTYDKMVDFFQLAVNDDTINIYNEDSSFEITDDTYIIFGILEIDIFSRFHDERIINQKIIDKRDLIVELSVNIIGKNSYNIMLSWIDFLTNRSKQVKASKEEVINVFSWDKISTGRYTNNQMQVIALYKQNIKVLCYNEQEIVIGTTDNVNVKVER